MKEPFQWRGRETGESTCVRCLRPKQSTELDRLLWCEECVARSRARTRRQGWIGGGAIALGVALYILLGVRPDFSLIPGAWVATVVAAIYLGYRVTRELLFGLERLQNRPAMEAQPPSGSEGGQRS